MTPASPRRRQREVITGSFDSTGRTDQYSDTARRWDNIAVGLCAAISDGLSDDKHLRKEFACE
jgi:hypothetical protein